MVVTSLYAGLLALLYLALSMRVVNKRHAGIALGDGGDPDMQRRIRGHGNFSEYVPLLLILLGLAEFAGTLPLWLLHILGVSLLAARLLHGIALSYTRAWTFGRFVGATLSFLLLLVLGLICLWRGVAALLI